MWNGLLNLSAATKCLCLSSCVCVCKTKRQKKCVSSHLWLDPAGNQDSTLQMLFFTGRTCGMLGKQVCCLSVWLQVRQLCRFQGFYSPTCLSALPLFFICSIPQLLQSAASRLKVNTEVTAKPPMMTKPMLIRISPRLRKCTRIFLSD